MKRYFINVWVVGLMLLAPAIAFISCADDEPVDDGLVAMRNAVEKDDASPQSPTTYDQPTSLDLIAKNLMQNHSSGEYQSLALLADFANQQYVKNERFASNVATDWFESALVECLKLNESQSNESQFREKNEKALLQMHYKRLIVLSNFAGRFTANDEGWQLAEASNLQFAFTDENGEEYVLTVKPEGEERDARIVMNFGWFGHRYDGNFHVGYLDANELLLKLPERVVVTLTQKGITRVSSVTKIDLDPLGKSLIDLNNETVGVSTTRSVCF